MAKKPPADPQSCASCRFFQQNAHDDAGYCRLFPPMPIPSDDGYACVHPITIADEWCGEYERVTH